MTALIKKEEQMICIRNVCRLVGYAFVAESVVSRLHV